MSSVDVAVQLGSSVVAPPAHVVEAVPAPHAMASKAALTLPVTVVFRNFAWNISGTLMTFTTPMITPFTLGSAFVSESTSLSVAVLNAACEVMPARRDVRFGGLPETAKPSTSLLPSQMLTNVGLASIARSSCVLPPRMNCVSAPQQLVRGSVASAILAPGTPRLLRMSTELARRPHAVVERRGVPATTAANEPNIGGHPAPPRLAY